MVYFYALVLLLTSSLFGAFCRSIMLGLGFVPNLGSGMSIFFASGSIFVFAQCFFMGGLRLLQPTTSRSTYFSEIASCCATLIFLPYILHLQVQWPHSAIERVEPLVYLTAFSIVHLFLKLSTFYASLQGLPSKRKGALGYFSIALLCIGLSVYFDSRWITSLEIARTEVTDTSESIVVGSLRANARRMQEGASLRLPATYTEGQTLSTRWAPYPGSQVKKVNATFIFHGDKETVYQSSTNLQADAWSEIRVPNEFLPEGLHSFEVRWTREAEPNWQRILGLRPIIYNLPESPSADPVPASVVSMSGPFVHAERPIVREPNIIVILIDGLAANHMSIMGYERDVTPSLDKLGYSGLSFPNMYSSSANTKDAIGALLNNFSVVPTLQRAGYSTIAFTQDDGNSQSDLNYESGIQSGFELFDSSYTTSDASSTTIKHAQSWIEKHQSIKFFMMVRLRGLENVDALKDIDGTYPESGRRRAIDMYDNALQRLDNQVGSLLKFIRDHETRKNTFVIVTSTYGHTFSLRTDGRLLSEPTLRTPLIINGPGIRKAKVSKRVDTNDLRATISEISGVKLDDSHTGKSVL